jgi:hypothetical protein
MNDKMFSNVIWEDLTAEQKDFVDEAAKGNKNIFLTGCAGAGKTLLATMATVKLRENNKNIKFLVYTKMLEKFVRDHFKNTNHVNEEFDKDTIQRFHTASENRMRVWEQIKDNVPSEEMASVANKFAEENGYKDTIDSVLIDECQDFQRPMIEAVKAVSKNQIWLGDATQQIFGHAMSKENEGYSSLHQSPEYDKHSLNTNFRNPLTIALLAQWFITLNQFDDPKLTLKDKVKMFIEPISNNQTQISSIRNQPNILIHASDEDSQYDAIAERIVSIQQNSESGSTNQIVITHTHLKQLKKIRKALKMRGIEGEMAKKKRGQDMENNFDFKDSNLILFGTSHSLKGLEFDYLIFPDTEASKTDFDSIFSDGNEPSAYSRIYNLKRTEQDAIINNSLFMLFTRAKKRIICSYIDKNDSIVYNRLKDKGLESMPEHFNFITAGQKIEPLTDREIEKKVSNVQYNLNNDNWPIQRKSSQDLKDKIKEVVDEDDLPF